MRNCLPLLLSLLFITEFNHGAEKVEPLPETVSYYQHVRPVLQANCQGCHQPAKNKADYVMTDIPALIAGGESGAAVVPGKPQESYLIELITTQAGEQRPEMPPKEEPLSDYQRSLIGRWIEQGAKDDTPENARHRYTQENLPKYSVAPIATSIDFSPDGKLIAMAGFHEVLLHEASGAKMAARLVGLSERIETVKFSPDGKWLAVAGGLPGRMGEIQIWDVATRTLKLSRPVGYDTAYGASWSPDGKLIAFGLPDNTVRAISSEDGSQVLFMGSHNDWVLDTDWGTKGEFLVSVGRDMTTKLTEVKTERFVDNLTSITPGALKGGVNAIERHPKQNHVLVGGSDGVPQIYRMKRETVRKIGDNANLIRKYPAMKGRIWDLSFRPDGKQFVAVSSLNGQGQINLYHSEYDATITPELKKLFETVRRSTNAKDNKSDKIEAFHTKDAKLIKSVDIDAAAFSVSFSPDGKTIAVGSEDGKIRLLNAADLSEKKVFFPVPIEKEPISTKGGDTTNLSKGKRHDYKAEILPDGRKLATIEIHPREIALTSPGEYIQLIATARFESGETADVTRFAKWSLDKPVAEIGKSGMLNSTSEGTANLTVSFESVVGSAKVSVAGLAKERHPDFIRDVNPVISRLGCNMGTCHGAKDGKNGFKLSLRGYDPLYDVRAFGDDHAGRRVNYSSPDDSLMLLKATGAVPHEGGKITGIGSEYYQTIRSWIAEGARLDTGTPKVARIELFPHNPVVQSIGGMQQLRVVAHWTDGKVRDVTHEAFIESGNTEVAVHDDFGLLNTIRRGEASILARFEGAYAATTLTVMGDRSGFSWEEPEVWNEIDKLVAAKLKRMKIKPGETCSDSEFIRRVYLDLTGLPPTSEVTRAFIEDKRETRVKRSEVIDQLIGSGEYVDFWTNKWSDMLQVNSKFLGGEGAKIFRNWIREEIKNNTPYDEFVYKILTASGSNKDNPPASYYKILREPDMIMENTTHLFLATRFNCNKCHDHPFERWTQDQYFETAAYFSQISLARDTKNAPMQNLGGTAVEGAKPLYEVVADKTDGEMKHDRTGEIQPPRFPYETQLAPVSYNVPGKPSRREKLGAWITSSDNQYFASSYANRIWGYLLGTGIIEPLDDIRAGNPPSNPQLLDYLTQHFIGSGFNVRDLMREICNSRTYQLSIKTNQWNENDEINFSHGKARRLPAEVLFDSVYTVTGAVPDIPGAGKGVRASQLYDSKLDLKSGFLANLGRPVRESSCECERSADMQMSAVMAFLSGPAIADAVGAENSDMAKLVNRIADDRKLIEEIYYRVLSRSPREAEIEAALASFKEIEKDHARLVKQLAVAESNWVGKQSELEIARFKKINAAKAALADYLPEHQAKLNKALADQKKKVADEDKLLKEREVKIPELADAFVAQLKTADLWTRWSVLPVAEVTASDKSKIEKQGDGSIRSLGGNKPRNLDYQLTANLKDMTVTGLMIEAIPDETFGGFGPGLNNNGNFVITEIEAATSPAADPKKVTKLSFADAVADFNQKGFDVKNVFNGKMDRSDKGWALSGSNIQEPHRAMLKFKEPLKIDEKGLRFQMTVFNRYGGGEYPLGRFRVWYTTDPDPLKEGTPTEIADIVTTAPESRTKEQVAALHTFIRENDAELLKHKFTGLRLKRPLPKDPKLIELENAIKVAETPITIDSQLKQLRQDINYSNQQAANRRLTAAQDLTWALINNPSFLFNR
ncbi:MAG: DUF1549 domain-containing protein [Verrucomicrobiales bacterium]|nr:DUF1549 domain-containing protein [Verrucomicrobiales bacterium]